MFVKMAQFFGVHGHGAFAPFFTVPAINARHVPEGLDPGHASIQDPLGNAIHTLTGGPVKGATVAVHGLGPIGLFAVNAAKMGATTVIAVDWDNTYQNESCKELGADIVLGKDDDVVASILEATDGRGVDNSCEFSGAASALSNAIHSHPHGRLCQHPPVRPVHARSTHERGRVPLSSPQRHQRQENVVHLGYHARPACKGAIDVDKVLTHRMGIAD